MTADDTARTDGPDMTITPGDRVEARDARGRILRGVVEYGPARDRDGIRGSFVKYWLLFDHQPEGAESVPWPVEDVWREPRGDAPGGAR